ncbi:MAG: BACON domain-containing protein, partial [Alistipes sp.]|nr:BACON domain-containing protein [Alistipes sp.]
MKTYFHSLLIAAVALFSSVAVSCTPSEPEHYQGTPTIEVTPASVTIGLAGGTTEAVTVTTPAEWTVTVPEGVSASVTAGNGDATVTFDVPEVSAPRNLKVTFTATGYVGGFALTKDAELTIIQSDINMSQVIYSDNCGEAVSKVNDNWPNVDAYNGWAPKG